MAKNKTTGKKTASKKSAEQLRKEAIASIDKNLAGDGDAKPKAGRKKARGSGKATHPEHAAKRKRSAGNGKLSGLDAAAQILAKAKDPLGCKDIVERAVTQELWAPGGKTPHATLYAAIIREIAKKGKDARFKKVDRGRFQLAR